MRLPIIAGNWKMNTTVKEAIELVKGMRGGLDKTEGVEKVLCPPFISITAVGDLIAGSSIGLGAQNLYFEEKGAYTGALSQQKGRFEIADGSTLFFDEIAELPLELQAKLLRVLQNGEFERLGSTKTLRVNARLIAATNRDLARVVQEGRFRKDLYYRLNVFPITIPPLRDRREPRSCEARADARPTEPGADPLAAGEGGGLRLLPEAGAGGAQEPEVGVRRLRPGEGRRGVL